MLCLYIMMYWLFCLCCSIVYSILLWACVCCGLFGSRRRAAVLSSTAPLKSPRLLTLACHCRFSQYCSIALLFVMLYYVNCCFVTHYRICFTIVRIFVDCSYDVIVLSQWAKKVLHPTAHIQDECLSSAMRMALIPSVWFVL